MPMLEQAREIVRKFNDTYGETLTEPDIILPENQACFRLPGTDGKAKMSKSLGNCIYLSDEPDVIKSKIMSMYTDPTHIRKRRSGTHKKVIQYLRIWRRFVIRNILKSLCQIIRI